MVKEMSGKEIRLHVDKTTSLDGSINVGEKVEAQATEKTTQCPLDTYSQRSRFRIRK